MHVVLRIAAVLCAAAWAAFAIEAMPFGAMLRAYEVNPRLKVAEVFWYEIYPNLIAFPGGLLRLLCGVPVAVVRLFYDYVDLFLGFVAAVSGLRAWGTFIYVLFAVLNVTIYMAINDVLSDDADSKDGKVTARRRPLATLLLTAAVSTILPYNDLAHAIARSGF